jgi:hypothetical protein
MTDSIARIKSSPGPGRFIAAAIEEESTWVGFFLAFSLEGKRKNK